MKNKKLNIFMWILLSVSIITLLTIENVYAATPSGARLYYRNEYGQLVYYDTNTFIFSNWLGDNVMFSNNSFSTGNFENIPYMEYFFMPADNTCNGTECMITGRFYTYIYGYRLSETPGFTDLDIQIENNGSYKQCSIISENRNFASTNDLFVITSFACYTDNTQSGYNLVFDNLYYYGTGDFYYALAYDSLVLDSSISYADLINNNNNNTQAIINNFTNVMNNAMANNNQAWQNFEDIDLDASDKQNPDTTEYSNYQQAEEDLFDQMDNADISQVSVAIDTNSSTWVWNRITEWLNSNQLLMSFFVSILSIGIIKMALGR